MRYLILAVALLTGCTERTKYGECWGVLEDMDPSLIYSINVPNIFIGVILSETFVVPAWVVADMLKCPTGLK